MGIIADLVFFRIKEGDKKMVIDYIEGDLAAADRPLDKSHHDIPCIIQ